MPLWSRSFTLLQPKPGATTLVTANTTNAPIILYQRSGNGKSLLIATDELWRWSLHAKLSEDDPLRTDAYERFWAQTVRWLATATDAKQVTLSLGQAEFEAGDVAEVSVRVYDTGFLPIADAVVQLTATDPDGNTSAVPVTASATTPGHYQARLLLNRVGTYRLQVEATARGVSLGQDEATLDVSVPRLEFERVARNDALLKALADASSGKFVEPDEASSLIPLLQESEETREVKVREALWDHPLVLMAIVLLLGAEWVLRKRRGLV